VQVARTRADTGFPLQRVILGAESFEKVASKLWSVVTIRKLDYFGEDSHVHQRLRS